MIWLSEEEARTLADAKAARQAAQTIIDELERKSRNARLEQILKQKAAGRAVNLSIAVARPSERQDFPKPASMPRRPRNYFSWKTPPPPESEAVRDTFALVRSFGGLAATYSLDRHQTMKALRQAGIDIYEEVARDWDRGISIQELSRQHGPGRDTIARWIRRAGRDIRPRNGNRRYDEALIAATFNQTNSVNRAAEAAEVSWATARAVLARYEIRADGRSQRISR